MLMARKLYPLGIQTFERIRKEDKLYIDKTEYIYHMTHTSGTYFFLARPRRFGNHYLSQRSKATLKARKICLKDLPSKSLRKNGQNILYCILT